MNFQDLNRIEEGQVYLDRAIKQANEKAVALRTKKFKDMDQKSKSIELLKINVITDVMTMELANIVKKFPTIDDLDEFYLELTKISLDYVELKKSLGAINWLREKITEFNKTYAKRIANSKTIPFINSARREFYGRLGSLLKQVKKDFLVIESARKTMKNFPTVKTGMSTVAIAGFPNVGKSTLLSKITTAKPDIKNYAFTTTSLNLGYFEHNHRKIQVIDTPGTLNRFKGMNNVEKQAYLAMKLVADAIVYVFDLTESSYPIDEQLELYDEVKKLGKKIYVYLSKLDLLKDEKLADSFRKKYDVIDISSFGEIIKGLPMKE